MGEAVFLHCNLALGRGNGDRLQKDLYQHAVAPKTVVVSVPDPVAGHCRLILHQRLLDTHRQVWLSFVRSLLLSPGSWYAQIFFMPTKNLFLWKFSVLLPDPQVGKSVVDPRTFATMWELLWYNCSPVHGIISYHFMVKRWGNSGNSDRLYFLGLQNHCGWSPQPQN